MLQAYNYKGSDWEKIYGDLRIYQHTANNQNIVQCNACAQNHRLQSFEHMPSLSNIQINNRATAINIYIAKCIEGSILSPN